MHDDLNHICILVSYFKQNIEYIDNFFLICERQESSFGIFLINNVVSTSAENWLY